MAKWNLDTIEADMAEIRESVDKLQEINRLQAQTIERIQGERIEGLNKNAWQAQKIAQLEEQLRQAQERLRVHAEIILTQQKVNDAQNEAILKAQQSLRNARDAALEEAWLVVMQRVDVALRIGTEDEEGSLQEAADAIRALKSTTQGSRE